MPKIKISNDDLDNVTEYNYLGVLIDNTLKYQLFVDDKYKKVNFLRELNHIWEHIWEKGPIGN